MFESFAKRSLCLALAAAFALPAATWATSTPASPPGPLLGAAAEVEPLSTQIGQPVPGVVTTTTVTIALFLLFTATPTITMGGDGPQPAPEPEPEPDDEGSSGALWQLP